MREEQGGHPDCVFLAPNEHLPSSLTRQQVSVLEQSAQCPLEAGKDRQR